MDYMLTAKAAYTLAINRPCWVAQVRAIACSTLPSIRAGIVNWTEGGTGRCHGNMSKAARMLSIIRSTIHLTVDENHITNP
jgi:hypothetical protein